MPLARTMKLKRLVVTTSPVKAQRYANDHGWKRREWIHVSKPEQLKAYHYYPVQNCELHVLGNHPLLGTDEFRRLLTEQNTHQPTRIQ